MFLLYVVFNHWSWLSDRQRERERLFVLNYCENLVSIRALCKRNLEKYEIHLLHVIVVIVVAVFNRWKWFSERERG